MHYPDFINKIICGDCIEVMKEIPDNVIDCVVTSPPYWGLRDYGDDIAVIWDGDENCEHEFNEYGSKLLHENRQNLDGGTIGNDDFREKLHGFGNAKAGFCSKCGAWRGQLGLEPTFELYIKHLCDIFDEIKRVLKKEGTIWINLGDTYGGSGNRSGHTLETSNLNRLTVGYGATEGNQKLTKKYEKSLCCIPERFMIEMINRGWILRNKIVWHKKNCMPSSAKDRFTVDWEYLLFFSKSKKYYFEQQFEEISENFNSIQRRKYIMSDKSNVKNNGSQFNVKPTNAFMGHHVYKRNKRCMWTINTKRFSDAHFAVFPEELVRTPILAGCPEFVCKKCGKAREPIFEPSEEYKKFLKAGSWTKDTDEDIDLRNKIGFQAHSKQFSVTADYKKKGYTNCNCKTEFEPGIVLDPFMGSGTTGLVARKLGRNFIGLEIKREYVKMAEKRLAQEYLL